MTCLSAVGRPFVGMVIKLYGILVFIDRGTESKSEDIVLNLHEMPCLVLSWSTGIVPIAGTGGLGSQLLQAVYHIIPEQIWKISPLVE
eukprot:g27815.t1